jgi:hypothetical protein
VLASESDRSKPVNVAKLDAAKLADEGPQPLDIGAGCALGAAPSSGRAGLDDREILGPPLGEAIAGLGGAGTAALADQLAFSAAASRRVSKVSAGSLRPSTETRT